MTDRLHERPLRAALARPDDPGRWRALAAGLLAAADSRAAAFLAPGEPSLDGDGDAAVVSYGPWPFHRSVALRIDTGWLVARCEWCGRRGWRWLARKSFLGVTVRRAGWCCHRCGERPPNARECPTAFLGQAAAGEGPR